MKVAFFILASFLTVANIEAQTIEPQILILSPNHVKYDEVFAKEIDSLNHSLKKNNREELPLNSPEFKKQPANIQRIMVSEFEFLKTMDFAKSTSRISEGFLVYKFFEKFPNLLILLKDTQSDGKLEDLKRMAEEAQLQYVLNFPTLTFYKESSVSFAKLSVQLYDHSTNSLLIDTSYVGDWSNPGFEFACHDSSLGCTMNNSISQALDNVVYTVARNSPTLKRERVVRQERQKVLQSDYYKKKFDKSFISPIVPATDSNIVLDKLYQLLVSNDGTKCVGFFIEKKSVQNFKQLSDNKQDASVSILNNKSIKDSGYLNDIPQTYAYIVKAVKFKGKWYYEKSNVTYFEPEDNEDGKLQYFNNLQDWGFFKDDLAIPDPDFWETHLFKKVRDLRKDPDWDRYGETIWKREEEENRNYIGFYEIVADQLKGKKDHQPTKITVN